MHFAVVKLSFEPTDLPPDRKGLRSLVEKLRSRFKVCAAVCDGDGDDGSSIAIAALGSSSERLSQTLDAITEFCEGAGFGRIEAEQSLMDDLDAITDFEEGGESED